MMEVLRFYKHFGVEHAGNGEERNLKIDGNPTVLCAFGLGTERGTVRNVFAKSTEFLWFYMHFARGQKREQSTLINANRWFPLFCKHFDASSAHKLSSHKLSLVGSQNYGCEGKGVVLLEKLDPADFPERPCERGTARNGISKFVEFLFYNHLGMERTGNGEERNFKIDGIPMAL